MAQQDFTGKFWPIANANASEVVPGAAILQTRNGLDEPITLAGNMVFDSGSGLWVPVSESNPLPTKATLTGSVEAPVVSEIAVSHTTATRLPDSPKAGRRVIRISNVGGRSVYLGGSGVTPGKGEVLPPGKTVEWLTSSTDIYAVADPPFREGDHLGTTTGIFALVNMGNGELIAGTNNPGRIYRSSDYGRTWELVRELAPQFVRSGIYVGDDVVLVGTRGQGIWRSADRGRTWSHVANPAAINNRDWVYAFIETTHNTILTGTGDDSGNNAEIYRSVDGGESWTLAAQIPTLDVRSFAAVTPEHIVAGTKGPAAVYRSTDGGTTWAHVSTLNQAGEQAVYAMEYLGNNIVIAGTDWPGNIYRSVDGGLTWNVTTKPGSATVYDFAYVGRGVVLASCGARAGDSTRGNVWISTNYGETWSELQRLDNSPQLNKIRYLGDGRVIVGSGGAGMDGVIWRGNIANARVVVVEW